MHFHTTSNNTFSISTYQNHTKLSGFEILYTIITFNYLLKLRIQHEVFLSWRVYIFCFWCETHQAQAKVEFSKKIIDDIILMLNSINIFLLYIFLNWFISPNKTDLTNTAFVSFHFHILCTRRDQGNHDETFKVTDSWNII